jgi:hypothetical protein
MKKTAKKLSLNKETLKQLDRSEMGEVKGGATFSCACSGAPETCGPGGSCCGGASTCLPA